ncbi:MAG: hypothetical protein ACXW53_13705 [Candidatus Binatia bacterium]
MRDCKSNLRSIICFVLASMIIEPVHAASIDSEPANLVSNGSFEQGQFSPTRLPSGWSWDSWARTAIPVWDETEARTGDRSVKIISPTLDDARWIQSVPVELNKPYYLSGWVKTHDVAHSPEIVDAGANISLLDGSTRSPGILGTQDWLRTGVLFNSESNGQVKVAARLGFYGGTTTGTAWFDDIKLTPVVPLNPHPSWRILVLIYRDTDFSYTDSSGTQHHVVASMTQYEVDQAAHAARQFVEKDIPALTSSNMLPTLTIRYPDRALSKLSPHGGGWWPSPENTAGERDPAFDSVIVIWDPRATDQITGKSIWLGSAAGLTPAMGTGQAYTTMIIEAAFSYGHRNVFKHEWGHSILEFFNAIGTAPRPKVENHTVANQYVNCLTGAPYVWVDETDSNPIPNSIYHNDSGFTHDYYSGMTARAAEPARCLGITGEAWAYGGPVSHSASPSMFTASQIINDKVNFVVQSTSFNPNRVAGGSAGVFTIKAVLTKTSPAEIWAPIKAVVKTLTNGNTLLSATEGNGSAGSKQAIDAGSDDALTGNESLTVQFRIGLATLDRFSFHVDIEGDVLSQP